jgi:hypothetical protein
MWGFFAVIAVFAAITGATAIRFALGRGATTKPLPAPEAA